MKPVTLKEVKYAAKHSLRMAVRCSLKKWRYYSSKTLQELRGISKKEIISASFCALCNRYQAGYVRCERNGNRCPLYVSNANGPCYGAYYKAFYAFKGENEVEWKKYSAQVVKKLESVLR